METTPFYCEYCREENFVKPNGDCPTCGRLITLFPGFHMAPGQTSHASDMTQEELASFIADRAETTHEYARQGDRVLAAHWAQRLAHNVKYLRPEGVAILEREWALRQSAN